MRGVSCGGPCRKFFQINCCSFKCRAGIACIVPPKGWAPPFALDKGTNGQSADSFKFSIRKQLTSHLCMRSANTKQNSKSRAAGRLVSCTTWA